MSGRGHKWRRTAITNVGTQQILSLPLNSQTARRARTWRRVPGITAEFRASYRAAAHAATAAAATLQKCSSPGCKIPRTSTSQLQALIPYNCISQQWQPWRRLCTQRCVTQQQQPDFESARVHDAKHHKQTQPSSGLRAKRLHRAKQQLSQTRSARVQDAEHPRQAQPRPSFVPSSFSPQQCLPLSHFPHRFGVLQQPISLRRGEAAPLGLWVQPSTES